MLVNSCWFLISQNACTTYITIISLETNDQGFRAIKNKNNKENILFLGDSISVGLGVDGNKIFPSIVSSKLNYNGFNFSINGYSTDQLYIILDNVIDFYAVHQQRKV